MASDDSNRKYVRVNNEFNVRLVLKDAESRRGALEINKSKSINVSGNGMLLNVDEKLEVGSILNITFIKPNSFDFFKGKGKIVRVEKDNDNSYKVGITFIDLSPEDMNMLDFYIRQGDISA